MFSFKNDLKFKSTISYSNSRIQSEWGWFEKAVILLVSLAKCTMSKITLKFHLILFTYNVLYNYKSWMNIKRIKILNVKRTILNRRLWPDRHTLWFDYLLVIYMDTFGSNQFSIKQSVAAHINVEWYSRALYRHSILDNFNNIISI